MLRRAVGAALLVLWASPAFATHVFSIPDFCTSPTKTATGGNWNTSGSWSPSGVPGASDVVSIPNGVTITVDISNAVAASVCISGVLTWGTSGTKGMTVNEIEVNEDGEFRLGTSASPFTGTATLQFRGTCSLQTGTVMSPGIDPEQYGCGFLGFGKVYIVGSAKTPYVRLSAAPSSGATSLTLSCVANGYSRDLCSGGSFPSGWASGDGVVIPDTTARSLLYAGSGLPPTPAYSEYLMSGTFTKRYDRVTLSAAVTSASASVSALTYDHECAKDHTTTCEFYPYIANLTRNVTIKSEDSAGTRGHMLFTDRADVDIRNVLIKDMGRTTISPENCTLFTTGAVQATNSCTAGTGTLTQIGTNQIGRYPVHFHHLYGPVNVGDTGYQCRFDGSVVTDALKWPITLHNTNYCHIQNNIVAFYTGPAIVTETGSENYNLIDGNFLTAGESNQGPWSAGDIDDTTAAAGIEAAGIWMRAGANNYLTNNIAGGLWNTVPTPGGLMWEVGFKFFSKPNGSNVTIKIPNYRGADLTDSMTYTTADPKDVPILQFDGNECFQMSGCLTIWHTGNNSSNQPNTGIGTSTISNLTMWHTYQYGVFLYPVTNLVFDGLKSRNRPDYISSTATNGSPIAFTSGDYRGYNLTVRNADVQGSYAVIGNTDNIGGTFLYENSTSYADYGVAIWGYAAGLSGQIPYGWGSGAGLGADPGTAFQTWTIRNVVHNPNSGASVPIRMCLHCGDDNVGVNDYRYELPVTVNVSQYQGGTQSFGVYFDERASEHWSGGLAPCTDTTTIPEIDGIVCGIQSSSGRRRRSRLRLRADAANDSVGWMVAADMRGVLWR